MIRIFLLILSTLTIAACSNGPELTTIGTVDYDKMITAEEIHEMGLDAFVERYSGKEITIANLGPLGTSRTYNKTKGQCKFSYQNKTPGIPVRVTVYANKFPNFVVEDDLKVHKHRVTDFTYDKEIDLPLEVCTVCQWDSETKACFLESPHTVLTGKIISQSKDKDRPRIYIAMKLSGISY